MDSYNRLNQNLLGFVLIISPEYSLPPCMNWTIFGHICHVLQEAWVLVSTKLSKHCFSYFINFYSNWACKALATQHKNMHHKPKTTAIHPNTIPQTWLYKYNAQFSSPFEACLVFDNNTAMRITWHLATTTISWH